MIYQYHDFEYRNGRGDDKWRSTRGSNFAFWIGDDFDHSFEFRDARTKKEIGRNLFMRIVVNESVRGLAAGT